VVLLSVVRVFVIREVLWCVCFVPICGARVCCANVYYVRVVHCRVGCVTARVCVVRERGACAWCVRAC
jgi:hypothetical protein